MVSGLFQYIFTATSNFEKSSKHNESSISQQIVNKSVDTSKRTEVQSMNKTLLALVLGLIPGLGHLYLKKFGRFILYSGGAVFLFIFAAFCTIALGARDIAFLSLFLLAVLWVVNLLDLVITIINQSKNKQPEN